VKTLASIALLLLTATPAEAQDTSAETVRALLARRVALGPPADSFPPSTPFGCTTEQRPSWVGAGG
jgi:hypothetical protein